MGKIVPDNLAKRMLLAENLLIQ